MPWLVAEYQGVGLFSLKHIEATSSGGKASLIPTPFALRTALLDVAIRLLGIDKGEEAFQHLRSLTLALRPPERVAVSGLFIKILKPEREEDREQAMQKTIAFREYVHWQGPVGLALGGEDAALDFVHPLLVHLTYWGKRGSFVQLLRPPERKEELPPDFILLQGKTFSPSSTTGLPAHFTLGIIQRLDDWGPDLTWEEVNVYSPRQPKRMPFDVIFPYRVVQAGRGYTVYERIKTEV